MNQQVSHSQFGAGTVIGQTAAIVTVKFSGEYGEKKFHYPAAFEDFLTLRDKTAQTNMDDVLRQIREKLAEERRVHNEENDKHQEELKLVQLEQRRSAMRKSAAARKNITKPAAKSKKQTPKT
jgi:hypothetical protein